MGYCHTNNCSSGTTAASAAATVQAFSDKRVCDAVNGISLDINTAARNEQRHTGVGSHLYGLSEGEKQKVLDTLKSRGFDARTYGVYW